jgi:YD repeat-containing protein
VNYISFKNVAATRMTTTKQYHHLDPLSSISSAIGSLAIGYSYGYNQANQRAGATLADGSYWVYTYDDLGQVVSGKRYWSDATPVVGQQFEYAFDDIGDRTQTRIGGDQNGVNLHPAALVNAADGNVVGQYEYGPFGEVIRLTGPLAKANPFRFSTKYQDDETDSLY